MRRFVFASACLAMLAAARPAPAHEPVPPDFYQAYGPLRICDGDLAFDVKENEGYIGSGDPSHVIFWKDGALNVDQSHYNLEELKPRGHARGEIELPGLRLQRLEIPPRYGSPASIIYVHVKDLPKGFRILKIESGLFEGSERDRALLERIAFGDRARQMCASVPLELQPVPQRNQLEVSWLSPARHRGPLTICRAGLTFDVASGEEAMLGWGKDQPAFRIVAGDRSTDIAGFDELLLRRAGEKDAKGSLSRDPRFVTGTPPVLRSVQVPPSSRPGRVHVALWWRADPETYWKEGVPALFFTFDRDTTKAERRAFIARVRTQRPQDRCFAPDPS